MWLRALMLSVALSVPGIQANEPSSPEWVRLQFEAVQATTDPIAKRLLLEHLLDALVETDPLWLRVKGQLVVLDYFEEIR
jgi:hypothetical protein